MPIPLPQPDSALDSFAPRLLAWFETSGRHDLPWQQHQTETPNPYIAYSKRIDNVQSLTVATSFNFTKVFCLV
ncbi:hypothetical protein [uncultured Psychrobacter sp.]|uniref:hypothetical protein n=1 Tax=uncultured Psychrobacter sp. TaxID=259303 RepID=UPI0034593FA5